MIKEISQFKIYNDCNFRRMCEFIEVFLSFFFIAQKYSFQIISETDLIKIY